MAVTVTGTVGGTPISFPTNTALQTALAQQFLASAAGLANALITNSGQALSSAVTVDIAPAGSVLTGTAAIPSEQLALDGQFGVYFTGGTSLSTVVAADNSNSAIVNNNPFGGLIASTGAGGNVLLGLAGQNQFVTGTGGQDLIVLNGAANSLVSNGSDAVLVGGPSTITAAAGGLDNVLLTAPTTLAFINGSRAGVDTITGSTGSAITLAGTGATSVVSGTGPESFFVDTAAGNVTLNANLQANDAFTFVKNAATTPGAANVVVNNFAVGDTVNVHGYAGAQFTISASGTGSVLALTDGSTVTFNNVSAATLAATVKPI